MIWKTQTVSINVVAVMLHDPEVLFSIKDASKGYIGLRHTNKRVSENT